jgi:preprotein translocase subunit SecA
LFVLGTERHEARRIDNQLRGRSGRQGDPGESRFYLSLEDDLMRRFQGERVKSFMSWANVPEDEPIEHSMITKSIAQAQVRVEGHNFDIRKRVLEYDDVVNMQRKVIYGQRRELLEKDDLSDEYLDILEELVLDTLEDFAPPDSAPANWDWDTEALYRQLLTIFPVPPQITSQTLEGKSEEELETLLIDALRESFGRKAEEIGQERLQQVLRWVMLRSVDQHWQRHLTDLDVLREGIGLMSIAQRDPLVEYKREAFNMWQELQGQIRAQAARDVFRVQINTYQPPVRRQMQAVRPGNGAATSKPEPARKTAKDTLGRNDPCWCGSGKKYKHCHMKEDRAGGK